MLNINVKFIGMKRGVQGIFGELTVFPWGVFSDNPISLTQSVSYNFFLFLDEALKYAVLKAHTPKHLKLYSICIEL